MKLEQVGPGLVGRCQDSQPRLGRRDSEDALIGFLNESFDYVLHPTMRLLLNRQGFQAVLLAPDPAHHRSSHNDAFFVRQIDGQGTRLANLQGNIAREFPPAQRKVPDRVLSLEQASVVRNGAVHGEATCSLRFARR